MERPMSAKFLFKPTEICMWSLLRAYPDCGQSIPISPTLLLYLSSRFQENHEITNEHWIRHILNNNNNNMSSLADLIAQKRVNSEDESDSFDEFEPEDLKQPIVPKRPVKQESSEGEPTDPTPIPQRPTKKNGEELKQVPPGDSGTTVDPGPPKEDPEISVPVIPARPKRPIKEDKADQAETEDGKSAETCSAASEEEPKAERVLESQLGPDDVDSETIEAGDEGETKVVTKADTKVDSRSPEPVIPPRPSKQPVIPQRPQRAKTQEQESPVSRNEEGEVIDALPVIPQRPQRVKTQEKESQATREPEVEVQETQEEESTVQSPPKVLKEDSEPTSPNKLINSNVTDIKEAPLEPEPTHVDELVKTDSNEIDKLVDSASKQVEDCKPIAVIPPRPKKPLSRASTQDSIIETDKTKGKAPPPVPKKPSSKIAAFQEMLRKNQEAEEEKSKVFERSGSPPKSDRNEFRTNLNTLFALPGMARPGAIPAALKPQVSEREEEEKEKEEEPVQSDARRSRAKGPRGKRLPKSALEKVEFDDKRSIAVFDIWSSGNFSGEGVDFNKFKPRVIENPVAGDENIEKALNSEIEREDAEQSVESKDASVLIEENAEEQQGEQKEEEQAEPDVEQRDTSFEDEDTNEKLANSTILQTIDGDPELSKPEEEAESVEVEQEDDADIDKDLSPDITPKEDNSISRLEQELDVAKEE